MSFRHAQPSESANGRQSRRSSLRNASTPPQQPTQKRRRWRNPLNLPFTDSEDEPSPQKKRRWVRDDNDDDGDQSTRKDICDIDDALTLINESYWKKKGAILGRCVEMWDRFFPIIDEGISRDPDCNENDIHSELENQQYDKFLLLIEVAPAMIKLLQRAGEYAGPEFSMNLDIMIDSGRKQARRVDVNGIRRAISQWPCLEWEPAHPGTNYLLGFNHHVTGGLLCPATSDWGDANVRNELRLGAQEVKASDLPNFLWPKGVFDIEDTHKGFLRSNLLVTAYKHVFISPSAAKEADRSGRGGNAALHSINWVTYESIAYIATVTRYALSDEPTFTPTGRFPYRDFYRELLKLKETLTENGLKNLLQWWNEQIFPRSIYTNDDGVVGVRSAGAIMREQAKAKCAAAASVPSAEASES